MICYPVQRILYVGSKNSIVHGNTLDKMSISFNEKNEVMFLNNTDKIYLVVLIEASQRDASMSTHKICLSIKKLTKLLLLSRLKQHFK